MNNEDAINIINQLVSISVKNEKFYKESSGPLKSFGILNSNVSFIGQESFLIYQEGLQKLYTFNKEIEQTISQKDFEQCLINLIRNLRDHSKNCDENYINEFFNKFLILEKYELEILYELWGIQMESAILNLGNFVIYNFLLTEGILAEKYPMLQINKELFFGNVKSNFFLGVKVYARDSDKAVEIADSLVETFENVMNYMISDLSHERSVGVFNFRGSNRKRRIICSSPGMALQNTRNISFPVEIENAFFTDSSQGNDKIWFIITKNKKNEIEKRIIQSVEWIGKGVHDKDRSKALVQFVFAIEGMLQFNENTIITPSIVSQLSDYLAFIIQDDPIKRENIAKLFKQTYSKRSAIAHSGAKVIEVKDLQLAFNIAKLMVISFLTVKPFCDMKTLKEFNEYITKLKFK